MPKCFSFKVGWTNPSSESSESSDPGLHGRPPGPGASKPRGLEASEPRGLETSEASRLRGLEAPDPGCWPGWPGSQDSEDSEDFEDSEDSEDGLAQVSLKLKDFGIFSPWA